jgi:hypothetical protein
MIRRNELAAGDLGQLGEQSSSSVGLIADERKAMAPPLAIRSVRNWNERRPNIATIFRAALPKTSVCHESGALSREVT